MKRNKKEYIRPETYVHRILSENILAMGTIEIDKKPDETIDNPDDVI